MTLFEQHVLRLVALGCNRREIAVLLNQSADEVETCQEELKRKAGVIRLCQLAHWARVHKIILPHDRLSPLEQAQIDAAKREIG